MSLSSSSCILLKVMSVALTGGIALVGVRGVLAHPATIAGRQEDPPVSFLDDVAPILQRRCVGCHNERKAENRYDLSSYQKLLTGGTYADGGPTIVPGQPDESYFIELVRPDGEPRMPWKLEPLPANELALLERWVAEGAKYDGHDPAAPWTAILAARAAAKPLKAPEVYPRPLPVTALAFSPDGARLWSSGYAEILDFVLPEATLGPRGVTAGERVFDLAINAQGTRMAAAVGAPGRSGAVLLYRLEPEGRAVFERRILTTPDAQLAVAFSPDGNQLAAGGTDRAVRVWNLADLDTSESANAEDSPPTPTHVIEDHADWILDLAFSPDATRLATGSRDKTSKVFDLARRESLATFPNHGQPVHAAVFVGDNATVASAGGDGLVRIWNADQEGNQLCQVDGLGGAIFRLAVTPDGSILASAGIDGKVRLINPANGAINATLDGPGDWINALTISPNAQRLAVGGHGGVVKVWNLSDLQPIAEFQASPLQPNDPPSPPVPSPSPTPEAEKLPRDDG